MNLEQALEGARVLYHRAVDDYNTYIEKCGVLLAKDLDENQQVNLEILQQRVVIMQDYFNNIKDARDSFEPNEDM